MSASIGFATANDLFYDAFARADAVVMAGLWARRLPVFCCHPGAIPLTDRDAIVGSWRQILRHGHPGEIVFVPRRLSLVGGIGVACGIEIVGQGQFACTNMFAEEDGGWRMVHHHAGPVMPAARISVAPVQGGQETRH
jgi:hypothetical protein